MLGNVHYVSLYFNGYLMGINGAFISLSINGEPAPDNELMVNSRIIICFQKLFPVPPTAQNSDTAPPFPIPLP